MKKENVFYHLLFCFFCSVYFSACSNSKNISTNFVYFQNGIDTVAVLQKERVIQQGDQLHIQVFSKTTNQEQAAVFNLTNSSGTVSQPSLNVASPAVQGYQVQLNGMIEMPIIGYLQAEGLTKYQLEKSLGDKLKDYVKSPLIIVRFLQFNVNVLGEVKMPGQQKFSTDQVTIIDALAAAGDLTDFGKRENITVIRKQGGTKNYYTVDLRNKNLFESPGYLLEPNDIVYVSPTDAKLKNLNVDPEKQRRTGVILAVTATLISIATLLVTSLK